MNYKIFTLLICISLVSCGGTRTFHEYARAGDTVAISVGMQETFNKDNITVTITPSIGIPIVLSASDPAIRAIINFYPDPISNMIVSREISEDTSPSAQAYAEQTLINANNDKDYYQTTVFVDLPLLMPIGLTNIEVTGPTGITHSATLDIIEGIGTAHSFKAEIGDTGTVPLTEDMLNSLSRSTHTEVSFDAVTLPHAIEINFTHDPDNTVGGTGEAFVVNPLGYRKNLSWSDDGTNLKIIMTESQAGLIDDIKDYKFYVAGTTTNLQLQSVDSFDINGNAITGTSALLTVN
ncbi:MAG: hypothetical protein KAT90_00865 [Gammaproteobacteria bacterium]|nr:hypothetical protein [Gammaproteobacteria bacterium]